VQVPVPFSRERRQDQPEAREALTSLAASGYLEHKPRVGFFVRVLSSDDLADIYHWREILEREAFTMAIPRLQGS
jgi:DNA-binding GntR family transcriptional regulator